MCASKSKIYHFTACSSASNFGDVVILLIILRFVEWKLFLLLHQKNRNLDLDRDAGCWPGLAPGPVGSQGAGHVRDAVQDVHGRGVGTEPVAAPALLQVLASRHLTGTLAMVLRQVLCPCRPCPSGLAAGSSRAVQALAAGAGHRVRLGVPLGRVWAAAGPSGHRLSSRRAGAHRRSRGIRGL